MCIPYRNTNISHFRQPCGFRSVEVLNNCFLRQGFWVLRRSFETNQHQLTGTQQAYHLIRKRKREYLHCSRCGRSIPPLLPFSIQDRLISRASNGPPESGRGRRTSSSSSQIIRLRRETSRGSGQARHCTELQPCKSRRPHGCGRELWSFSFSPYRIHSRKKKKNQARITCGV